MVRGQTHLRQKPTGQQKLKPPTVGQCHKEARGKVTRVSRCRAGQSSSQAMQFVNLFLLSSPQRNQRQRGQSSDKPDILKTRTQRPSPKSSTSSRHPLRFSSIVGYCRKHLYLKTACLHICQSTRNWLAKSCHGMIKSLAWPNSTTSLA